MRENRKVCHTGKFQTIYVDTLPQGSRTTLHSLSVAMYGDFFPKSTAWRAVRKNNSVVGKPGKQYSSPVITVNIIKL
jgi:hypothetical protein